MIDIIVISWNRKKFLKHCIQSILDTTKGMSCSIIVVDNGSTDGTHQLLSETFPQVTTIRNEVNRGTTVTRNQAIRISRAPFIMFLDSDTEVTPGAVSALCRFLEQHLDVSVVAPQLISPEGNLQLSCRRFPDLLTPVFRRLAFIPAIAHSKNLSRHLMFEFDHSYVRPVSYAIGACLMIRRKALNQVGLLDEKIFYSPEDIDICFRMWLGGWKVFYYPHAKVIHHEQRTTKKNPFSIIAFRHLKGLLYYFSKYRIEDRKRAALMVQRVAERSV